MLVRFTLQALVQQRQAYLSKSMKKKEAISSHVVPILNLCPFFKLLGGKSVLSAINAVVKMSQVTPKKHTLFGVL